MCELPPCYVSRRNAGGTEHGFLKAGGTLGKIDQPISSRVDEEESEDGE